MKRATCPLILLALLLLSAPGVQAYPESEAAAVREQETGLRDVVRVWHEPEQVAAGSQWRGFIELAPDANITMVQYQICEVGNQCFAPPHAATEVEPGIWRFDTDDYRPIGRDAPVDYEEGMLVGFQWLFNDGDDLEMFPHGVEVNSPECEAMGWIACADTHYFSFTIAPGPGSEGEGASGPAAPIVALALLGAAALVTRRRA
ncbi:MAG: hypothetical protein ACPGQL_09010 [Thermoplasmatota archaeon]